jgi:hypothetical protein
MAQNLAQLTDMWMVNPTMFDPTQQSNQFSNYNNAALPWPPTYNTGAGGPVNAATGQPIPSFQQWQQQNPGGMSINTTPAAPAPPQQSNIPQYIYAPGGQYSGGGSQEVDQLAGRNTPGQYIVNPAYAQQQMGQQQQPAPQAAPQASGPPNNWQAAINALSNPGKVQTMGANVPQVTGYQPSGGVNQAFLNQAGAGQGMNQNFLNALRSIQARPQ